MTKLFKAAMAVLLAMVLAGCSEGPPAEQAKNDAKNLANSNLPVKSFELTKIDRANGWKKDETYVVRHDLQFEAIKNYAAMLAENALNFESEMSKGNSVGIATGVMKLRLMRSNVNFVQPLVGWIEQNKEKDEYRNTVGKYLGRPSTIEGAESLDMLVGAYYVLAEAKIPLDIRKGDIFTYWTEISYMKSEKGWVKAPQ